LAAIFTLCQIATIGHFAATDHQICEHGTYCHTEAAPPLTKNPNTPCSPEVLSGSGGQKHDHHHCQLAPYSRMRPVVILQLGPVSELQPTRAVITLPPSSILSWALYRLAPKLSPPA
jgi:hypothetical protein